MNILNKIILILNCCFIAGTIQPMSMLKRFVRPAIAGMAMYFSAIDSTEKITKNKKYNDLLAKKSEYEEKYQDTLKNVDQEQYLCYPSSFANSVYKAIKAGNKDYIKTLIDIVRLNRPDDLFFNYRLNEYLKQDKIDDEMLDLLIAAPHAVDDWTAFLAFSNGHIEVCEKLIGHGLINANRVLYSYFWWGIDYKKYVVSYAECVEKLKILKKLGANINLQPVIHLALDMGQTEMVKALIDLGADLALKNDKGQTAFSRIYCKKETKNQKANTFTDDKLSFLIL